MENFISDVIGARRFLDIEIFDVLCHLREEDWREGKVGTMRHSKISYGTADGVREVVARRSGVGGKLVLVVPGKFFNLGVLVVDGTSGGLETVDLEGSGPQPLGELPNGAVIWVQVPDEAVPFFGAMGENHLTDLLAETVEVLLVHGGAGTLPHPPGTVSLAHEISNVLWEGDASRIVRTSGGLSNRLAAGSREFLDRMIDVLGRLKHPLGGTEVRRKIIVKRSPVDNVTGERGRDGGGQSKGKLGREVVRR